MADREYSERRRNIEHIAPIAFAFLLKYLPIWLAMVLAVAAVVYGAIGSRLLVKGTMRRDEAEKGYSIAKISYAAMVLLLIIMFRDRGHMWIVAGAWAIMAFGDSFANMFGRAYGRDKLPWNRNKSWVGSVAFVFFGSIGCAALIGWFTWLWPIQGLHPILEGGQIWTISVIAAVVCAMVESLPIPLVDNITVPAAGALVIWLMHSAVA